MSDNETMTDIKEEAVDKEQRLGDLISESQDLPAEDQDAVSEETTADQEAPTDDAPIEDVEDAQEEDPQVRVGGAISSIRKQFKSQLSARDKKIEELEAKVDQALKGFIKNHH